MFRLLKYLWGESHGATGPFEQFSVKQGLCGSAGDRDAPHWQNEEGKNHLNAKQT